jgi:hypothetical protein
MISVRIMEISPLNYCFEQLIASQSDAAIKLSAIGR